MVGFDNFVRHNPYSDKFDIQKFHHMEFFCSDATTVSKRFIQGFGMNLVAKSDLTTGNKKYSSYAVQSGEMVLVFTAPYSDKIDTTGSSEPHANFSHTAIRAFVNEHGLACQAVAIRVGDAKIAYEVSTKNGAIGHMEPYTVVDRATNTSMTISEIKQFGDVVIRWVSGDFTGPMLPNYEAVPVTKDNSFGIDRIDHIVSNVPKLFEAYDYMEAATGFHQFGEFTAEDVGTVDSGLNSMVMANNNEFVLMPINEPTFGTPRKSQIQNFLEHNNGAGIQHVAVKTEDIFRTMRLMKAQTDTGGMDFMPAPGPDYYRKLPERIGADTLSAAQIAELEELGLLADKDDMGVLLQVFTKPIGDRPTIFFEIIQRIGCDKDKETGAKIPQSGGCGGFGKGNFGELFKSIETFEKQQEKLV